MPANSRYPPAHFFPDDGNLFDVFDGQGPEDDESYEVDQGGGHHGDEGGCGVAEEDDQGGMDEPRRRRLHRAREWPSDAS